VDRELGGSADHEGHRDVVSLRLLNRDSLPGVTHLGA
jgi:hypothetical protein